MIFYLICFWIVIYCIFLLGKLYVNIILLYVYLLYNLYYIDNIWFNIEYNKIFDFWYNMISKKLKIIYKQIILFVYLWWIIIFIFNIL